MAFFTHCLYSIHTLQRNFLAMIIGQIHAEIGYMYSEIRSLVQVVLVIALETKFTPFYSIYFVLNPKQNKFCRINYLTR